ncbi:MAG: hypothetical protein IKX88_14810 [Thermoguttaceae bacterium]|nr:hypothetical protein [Thermoguttaceae bacterium]MBR5759858.1 hypothetical protein [Thermoguttaceae bacterium]
MFFLIPKRNVLAETIDSAKEESLDKEVRYSTYKRKRTILFLVKIVLFVLLWTAFRSFLFAMTRNGRDWPTALMILLSPFVAYALAALICAPYKIKLTKRRLRAVDAPISAWFRAWIFTIVARLWLFAACPVAFFFGAFNDEGNPAITYIVLFVLITAPWLTSRAYSTERVALRAPGSRVKRTSNATERQS